MHISRIGLDINVLAAWAEENLKEIFLQPMFLTPTLMIYTIICVWRNCLNCSQGYSYFPRDVDYNRFFFVICIDSGYLGEEKVYIQSLDRTNNSRWLTNVSLGDELEVVGSSTTRRLVELWFPSVSRGSDGWSKSILKQKKMKKIKILRLTKH